MESQCFFLHTYAHTYIYAQSHKTAEHQPETAP